jgi:hypothetical protein
MVATRHLMNCNVGNAPGGGRRRWAHFDLCRINIGRIIPGNQFEDLIEVLESVTFSGAS